MGKVVDLDITDLAFNGKAVARMNGKVVFLNAGLPGETVRAEITRTKRNFNEAVVLDITNKSDERIPPVCTHFAYCGGCTWQDLQYQKQLQIKRNHVSGCIERIGGLEDVVVEDVLDSPEKFGYRNKMEFSFNTHPEKGFSLGLHRKGKFADIFELEECHLCSGIYSELVGWLREYVRIKKVAVYDVKVHTGYIRFLVIREAKNKDDLMINIVTNYGDFPSSEELVSQMIQKFPHITTIVHNQNGRKSNIAVGEIEKVLYGSGYIEEVVLGHTFRIGANSFFQTNTLQAERLYQKAFKMLAPEKEDKVLDLYCGTGTIAISLAPMVSHVTGVELVEQAIESAKVNAELNNCANVTFINADVKEYLNKLRNSGVLLDTVITDPPRSGMHPKVVKRLIEFAPKKILYISCNPSTFARDAKELVSSGFRLPHVQPVDMFPHTRHIELAAVFYRE